MARPRQFQRESALQSAMEVFWRKGYEAASVQELLDAMQINRGSMYDTFGDKRALFLATLDHYAEHVTRRIVDALLADGSPRENLHATLEAAIDFGTGDDECAGCLVTNSVMELAGQDRELRQRLRRVLLRVQAGFRAALNRAVEAGELAPDADTVGLARFFTGVLQGLVVMNKAAVSHAVRRDLVHTALSVLDDEPR